MERTTDEMKATSPHAVDYAHSGGFFYDDEQIPELDMPEEEVVEDMSEDSLGALKVEAESAQRLAVARNGATHVKGRAELAVVGSDRKWCDERMFRVTQLFDWTGGEPEEVFAAMRAGRVRARVSAVMGVGKSTKLPFSIARQMDHRVLYIAPDVDAICAVNKYVRDRGIGKIRRVWSAQVTEWVCAMTYSDFCGYAALTKRAELFRHFETLVMDEAFLRWPAVQASLKAFAVLAGPNTNLLLASANISTDSLDSMSSGQGTVKWLDTYVSPEEACARGKLVDRYLVDRTMVVLPSDERVHDMQEYYLERGVDANTLDSASSELDRLAVNEWLDGDSSTPRVIVVTPRYALSFNLRVAYVIVWPLLAEWKIKGDELVYHERPMPRTLVNQALSRTGRGIVSGAGGIVMGPEFADEEYVSFTDKIEEFVLLCAASIKPLRKNPYWAECYERFPNAIEPATAVQIRKLNLPACIAVRYLGRDGLFARKYHLGLLMFCQMDHQAKAGVDELPVGHDMWISEDVFGTSGKVSCKVPMRTAGEMQIIMHAIAMVSEGRIEMVRWRLPATMSYYDHADKPSMPLDVEAVQRRRLRRVRSFEKPLPPVVEQPKVGWTYTAQTVNTELGGAGTRRGVIVEGSRLQQAVTEMRSLAECNYEPPRADIELRESATGTVGLVPMAVLDGEVESPGGSQVCTLPAGLCTKLNEGRALAFSEFKYVIDAWRVHGNRFVASKLWDAYSHPWTSVCWTLLEDNIVKQVMRAGLAPHTYDMVQSLMNRFAIELNMTVRTSHVLKKKYWKLFTKTPTVDELMAAIRSGKFRKFAQSQRYMDRVVQLKTWLDHTLILAEKHGAFFPGYITNAQRVLPIHPLTALGNAADGGYVRPLLESDNPMSPHWRPS